MDELKQWLGIIPLREEIGNYDVESHNATAELIIPLREEIGNYDVHMCMYNALKIIPL